MRIALACVLAVASFASAVGADAPPNVVLIISDDQAWGDYSFMGHENIETPRLDKLAKESLTFTRGYVPDSLCRPSLVSILTGLYPHEHGVVGNDPPHHDLKGGKRSPEYLPRRIEYLKHIDDDPRLPELLKAKGYLSHQSGKWWEGNFTRGGFTHGMTHGDRTKGGRHGDKGLVIGRQGLAPIEEFVDHAIDEEKPFLLWYAPFLPHTPHTPPKRLLDKYRNKTDSLPMAKYWAMCEWFDETCGDLLHLLDERKLTDNTIVVYVTDNGWINQENASRYAPKSKRSEYDGGLRTPIMIRWPGHVKPRMDTEHLASSIDIAPTVLSAVGLDVPERMTGIDLLDEKAVAARDAIFGEILEHDIQHMTDPVPSLRHRWIIEGNYKLIVPYSARLPEGKVELYDLVEDPHEEQNLADDAKYDAIVERLRTRLDEWWTPVAAE